MTSTANQQEQAAEYAVVSDEELREERVLAILQEIRAEITRVNQSAGKTVFNPAATELLDELIEDRNA